MPDAEPADFPSTKFPRLEPRDPHVWIRIDDTWRPGRISKWVHEQTRDVDRWLVWAFYQSEWPAMDHAWPVYDQATIRPWREGEPAPDV
jgi:hypothetical protein